MKNMILNSMKFVVSLIYTIVFFILGGILVLLKAIDDKWYKKELKKNSKKTAKKLKTMIFSW